MDRERESALRVGLRPKMGLRPKVLRCLGFYLPRALPHDPPRHTVSHIGWAMFFLLWRYSPMGSGSG